jgi:hypothetical protein
LRVLLAGLTVKVAGMTVTVAGMTVKVAGMTVKVAGMTVKVAGMQVKMAGMPVKVAGMAVKVAGMAVKVAGMTEEMWGCRKAVVTEGVPSGGIYSNRSMSARPSKPESKLMILETPWRRMMATCNASRAEVPSPRCRTPLAASISAIPNVKISSAIPCKTSKAGCMASTRRIAL